MTRLGWVSELWRYPVKSMRGEPLPEVTIGHNGLAGDRAYAVLDGTDGRVASAKHPKRWPGLLDLGADFEAEPAPGEPLPAVTITLPDGQRASSAEREAMDSLLTANFGRPARLADLPPQNAEVAELSDDAEGTFTLPSGTFFDAAPVHLVTTATLDSLRELYPEGRWDPRRFRANVVVATAPGEAGFPEERWLEGSIALGEEVRLAVTAPCRRCLMTSLPQQDLPRDPAILRTAAQHRDAEVGVYATVRRGGVVRRGDPVSLMVGPQ
jgi:MOSC domain-containing protein